MVGGTVPIAVMSTQRRKIESGDRIASATYRRFARRAVEFIPRPRCGWT
jgi:hypothetical protein